MKSKAPQSAIKSIALTLATANDDDDDDFQNPSEAIAITQNLILSSLKTPKCSQPLKPSNGAPPPRKRQKSSVSNGKENRRAKQVIQSNNPRVSVVCDGEKVVTEERRNLSASIGSGSVEISESDKENGFDADVLQNAEILERDFTISDNGMESSVMGEEKKEHCSSVESASEVIQSTYVSDSCVSPIFDQTKPSDIRSIESDGRKEEQLCLLISEESNIEGSYQKEKSGIDNFNVCEDKSSLKAERRSLHSLSKSGDDCWNTKLREDEENSRLEASLHKQDLEFKSLTVSEDAMCLKAGRGSYHSRSIESRLLESKENCVSSSSGGRYGDSELGTQLNVLMDLCCEITDGNSNNVDFYCEENGSDKGNGSVECPLCGTDISHLSEETRQIHTNDCLDKDGTAEVVIPASKIKPDLPQQAADANPVLEWLRTLGLSRYEEAFVKEEVDWETLQWLTEEDLLNIGVTALGPRKKIVNALSGLRQRNNRGQDKERDSSVIKPNENTKTVVAGNKLITEFFQGPTSARKRPCILNNTLHGIEKTSKEPVRKRVGSRGHVTGRKVREIPAWCCIPGTPFRVDAFRFLRGDCSHWFLTHFHMDHYQGLTKSFCHGKIYCSSITAHLVNMKIGVPWERLQILPLNQKITIAGVNLTCLDANHCPGSLIILFEPPSGKAVLHTGDFRFSAEMAESPVLQSSHVHTLILDTTYCNPHYDFPKQEAVIQFVIEAIQAESFNPKTLFLIGTYTIGKERLFLEVARLLRKKVYVGAAKLRLLRCLGLSEEDMQWFTANEMDSHIHVVPLWTIASFKRMKHISSQYSDRFNLIVAFSPTGWTFGKGKKRTPGRRWQQGTIIRYEVPYSEHCSFTELREFVQFISPENIIPSVNNEGPESADAMTALLMSDP